MTLRYGLAVTQGHLKWYHSKAWVYGFLSHTIATTAVSVAVLTQYTNVTDKRRTTA